MYDDLTIYYIGFFVMLIVKMCVAFACYKAGKFDERTEWIDRMDRGEIEFTQRNIRPKQLRSRRV